MRSHIAWLAGAAFAVAVAFSAEAGTLDQAKTRGQLICGSNPGLAGFGLPDDQGVWKGLDVDECRAIAAAILNDPNKVKFLPINAKDRPTILASGEIDVLIRDSEVTFVRNTQLGLDEPAYNFFTAQTFMVRKSLNVSHAKDLNGATICLLTGTTLETNIADYNRANGIQIKTLLFDKPEEAFAAADSGRCDGYTDDGGSVAAARSTMKKPDDWMFIPETIGGLQPLGSFTRLGDQGWSRLVKWVQNAMVEGELLGVTKANVDQMKASSKDPEVRRYLGLEGGFGTLLGVDNDWAYRIAKDIGNYGEVYEAYFGEKGLGLPRGMNNVYLKGGLFMTASWK